MRYLTIIPLLALSGCAVREGPCEGMMPGGWCIVWLETRPARRRKLGFASADIADYPGERKGIPRPEAAEP